MHIPVNGEAILQATHARFSVFATQGTIFNVVSHSSRAKLCQVSWYADLLRRHCTAHLKGYHGPCFLVMSGSIVAPVSARTMDLRSSKWVESNELPRCLSRDVGKAGNHLVDRDMSVIQALDTYSRLFHS